MKLFYLFLVISFSVIGHTQCISNQNNVYSFTYNNNLYKIVKENQDWLYAQSCANNEGGQLAQINSQDEQDTIFKYVILAGITASNTVAPDGGNGSYLWLGGTDVSVEGEWNWSPYGGTAVPFWSGTGATGSVVGGLYNNWGTNGTASEPDNYNNNQDALGFAFTDWPIGVAGQWNDIDKSNTLYYIIEYVGDPSGINENESKKSFDIFPNPSQNQFSISFNETEVLSKI